MSRASGNALVVFLVFLGGCGKDNTPRSDQPETKDKTKKSDHSGWWCQEHGIPEHLCSLCLPDDVVKEKFKDKGDWCQLHDRAKSQCFKCDPKLYEKYEAMHVNKFGTKPPRPPEEEFRKDQ